MSLREIVILIVTLVLTIYLLSGKGANIVSGYAFMSEEHKAKYDEKKISRSAGIIFLLALILEFIVFSFKNYLGNLGVIILTFIFIFISGAFIFKNYKKNNSIK